MNAASLSFFSFIALYRYKVLLPGLDGNFIIKVKVPDIGSELHTVVGPNNRKISYPGYTHEEDLTLSIVIDEAQKQLITQYFKDWEASKYSADRTAVKYPDEYTRDVIVNLLSKDTNSNFKVYHFICFPGTVGLDPELDYANKNDKMKMTATLKVWDRREE